MNVVDLKFYSLIDELAKIPENELFTKIKNSFMSLPENVRRSMAAFFNRFGYWGTLHPEKEDFTEIRLKASALKNYLKEYVRLYGRLKDYRSKYSLYAVLSNWYRYDFLSIAAAKEYMFDDYFDLDLVRCSPDETVADLGAYTGDTVLSYIINYGEECYKRIYCYEITPSVFGILKNNVSRFRDVVCSNKGVSDRIGVSRIALSPGGNSANALGASGAEIETTTLDADIAEPLTLIKADIEGGEQKALVGAARHIASDRPKLLISVYHSNEDLWKIPETIDSFAPGGYDFYLRFKSAGLYPTEITLIALPQ